MKLSHIFFTPKNIKIPGEKAIKPRAARDFTGIIPSPWRNRLSDIRKALEDSQRLGATRVES
ncbi:hypothetical protein PISMIDRAFT_681965 [Pisolithus microcarpus 441]|uniref:Uncharacterized protein n=1 Tax=Pisolithus microcarpus 441 TaxID=765257 RepID=A0A0C9Z3I0_9AGAM|nr:hypothetical protein PISMIDRAFT_681965 [Pisolithus microcarpus 441]